MRKATLVFGRRFGWWAALAGLAWSPALVGGTFGSVIQLPGHISEIALDEPRSSLYAANFTAGQVEVISTTSNRLVSSLRVGGQPSGLCLSPDGRHLLVTNYNNFGGPNLSSVVLINLNDLTRQNYAMSNAPLGCAFGADGIALIITTVDLVKFRVNGGTFEQVTTIASLAQQALPVTSPTFPREITRASMAASGDGNYIFGATDTFVFAYQVPQPSAVLFVRPALSFVQGIAPPLVTASFDGSYFMAGQYLLDRRLRVIAQHPDTDPSQTNLGTHAIDFGARTVYASYGETMTTTTQTGPPVVTCTVTTDPTCTATPGTTTVTTLLPPKLLVHDADNLTVRDRLHLAEHLTGRTVVGGGGRQAWAISDSGITYLPLGDLNTVPQVRPNTQQVFVQFDYCQRQSIQREFRMEGPPGTDFQLSTQLRGVTFSPSRGVTPATVQVTVDFNEYTRVQGTTFGEILVTSQNAVNIVDPIQIAINVKDADQRGRVVTLPGKLVDILADPGREQFYVLEQKKNELHVFQNSDLRLLGTYRTGNRPTWMTLSADRRLLVVANSAGENLTLINLDTRQNVGPMFMPAGHQPVSVAADNGTVLAAVRIPQGLAQIDAVDLSGRVAYGLRRLGVYENVVHTNTAMVPMASMNGILIAEADGKVKLWDSASQEVVISRKDFAALLGAIAAGPTSVVVQNNVLNLSLVPQATFSDPPNNPAGFTFTATGAVRTVSPTGIVVDTGTVQRFDPRNPGVKQSPVRLVEQPLTPITFPFLRSLASLRNGTIVSTSSSGLVELPGNFDAGISIPRVTAVASAADFSDSLASGSLVSIFGQNLAPTTQSAGSTPLPTQLSGVCVTVNGFRMPLLYASPGQINGQLPFELNGQVQTVLHTPGGLSDIYYADVAPAAPAIFQLSVAGQTGTFPAVVRARNNLLATLANPLRPNEAFTVFLTGLGEVGPPVEVGRPAPSSPLSSSRFTPRVTVGDVDAEVLFAGLAPGFVGVYQINAQLPGHVPLGTQIPLTISVGGRSTTVNVRVVE
jgi:uncharacterized protein (TIGR03437 family)